MDHSQQAASIFNKYAESYENRFMDVSDYASGLNFLLNNLSNEQINVLDVACGPGNISKYLIERNSELKIDGIDLSENMISLARKNIPAGNFFIKDARAISSINKKYDLIISGFCFPYLTKEEAIQFISDAKLCLNPKGLLFISTMEKDYSESGIQKGSQGDEIMMHFHQESYLREALLENGFSIVFTERVTTINSVNEEVVDLMMVGKF